MIIYLLIIKYLFTEINHPSVTKETTFLEIISVALFYNIVTFFVSLLLYFPIVYGIKKIKLRKDVELIFIGLLLTMTTPIFYLYLSDWKHNDYYELVPELISWSLCFIISIAFYYLMNKNSEVINNSV